MTSPPLTSPPLSVIQKAVVRRVARLALPPGAKVLDAPCGAGAMVVSLRQRGLDASGADLEPEAQALLGEHFCLADLNKSLPWPDASFDALFSIEGIEHLENRFRFLREAHRVLKAGGILIITTPNIVSLRSRVRFLGSGFFHKDPRPLNESARHPLHHIGLQTFPDLRYALHTSGFQISQVTATHVKPVSYLYSVLAPWMWLYTRIAFRKEKDPAQRERNKEIRRVLYSQALLFGENMMILSRKV
jgi:cyclopropane fatty-acyl-phospholipid synthase-like methyltransferase